MKYLLLFILIFIIAPSISIASDIKPERRQKHSLSRHETIDAIPCCLVIALNHQNQLFSVYNAGLSGCLEFTDTIQMQQCFSFWNAFRIAGETSIENGLVACEAIYGANGMNCGTLVGGS